MPALAPAPPAACAACGGPPDWGMEHAGLARCNGCISAALAAGFAAPRPERPAPVRPDGACPKCGVIGPGFADSPDPLGLAPAQGVCPCRGAA